jgi:DNA polymerase III gamma/tau subunit
MRDAVMTLDQMARVGVTTVDEFRELLGEYDFGPEVLAAMLTGEHAKVFDAIDTQLLRSGDATTITNQLVGTLRDVLVLSGGGRLAKQGDALQARVDLQGKLDINRAVAGLRVLWDLKTKVRAGDDPRSTLDLAVVMVTEALTGQNRASSAPAPVAAPPRKLSLADLRTL